MPSVPGVLNYPTSLDDAISLIQASNNATATLTSNISVSDLLIPVDQPGKFTDSGFATLVDSLTAPTKIEIFVYTSKSGSNLVVPSGGRGAQGTTAQAFSTGNFVTQRPTARHHTALADLLLAIEAKLGIGADTPGAAVEALFSNGAGASLWRAIAQADVTGLVAALTALSNDIDALDASVTAALAGKQPLDSDLTAIAALSANGFLRKISGVWQMSAPVTAWEASWCFPTIVAPETIGTEPRPVFFAPPGASVTLTKMRLVWRAGTHANNTSTTFQVYREDSNGANPTSMGEITVNNSGPALAAQTENDVSDVTLSDGQRLACRISANTGTDTIQNVCVAMIGTQQPN